MSTLAPTFLIGSSSFFHVTRTALRSRMSSKFGKIQPWTAELVALERSKKSPLTYNGKDVVKAPAPSFLMESSSFLQATRTGIRSRMSSKFSVFRPWTAELPALECFENGCKCCEHSSTYILIGSSSFFHVTRTVMRSWMSSKFGKIQPWSGELAALECLKKIPIDLQWERCCERSSAIISDWIFFIFAGNKDSNKSSNEFEIQQDSIIDWGVTCP